MEVLLPAEAGGDRVGTCQGQRPDSRVVVQRPCSHTSCWTWQAGLRTGLRRAGGQGRRARGGLFAPFF